MDIFKEIKKTSFKTTCLKLSDKNVLNSAVFTTFTVKSRWALTADMVTRDQNGTKDITAFLDLTSIIALDLSKRLIMSSTANKKPFKLYKKTICSYFIAKTKWHLYKNQVIMKVLVQFSYDEAVVYLEIVTISNHDLSTNSTFINPILIFVNSDRDHKRIHISARIG